MKKFLFVALLLTIVLGMQVLNGKRMLVNWLGRIDVSNIVADVNGVSVDKKSDTKAYSLSEMAVTNIDKAGQGVYIMGEIKQYI